MTKYHGENDFNRLIASKTKYPEIHGEVESKVTYDGHTHRADIESNKVIYECKFGASWKAAIGQALLYAACHDKKAGVILYIRTNPKFKEKDLHGLACVKQALTRVKNKVELHYFYVNCANGKISKRDTLEWDND